MSKPQREIEIVESPTITPIRFVDGEEVRGDPEPNPIPFSVYVDGAWHGSTKTREQAERAAASERDADETITERALRLIRGEFSDGDDSPDIEWMGIQHTGGGCLAAEIIISGERGYVMVTDPEMGYAKWESYMDGDPAEDDEGWDAPFCVGAYDSYDHTEWVEEVSGGAYTDAEMLALVRKCVDHLTR